MHPLQVAHPRCFKSHESYDNVPKGGKYIYVTRNPRDVLVSFYHFLLSWVQVRTEIMIHPRSLVGAGCESGSVSCLTHPFDDVRFRHRTSHSRSSATVCSQDEEAIAAASGITCSAGGRTQAETSRAAMCCG